MMHRAVIVAVSVILCGGAGTNNFDAILATIDHYLQDVGHLERSEKQEIVYLQEAELKNPDEGQKEKIDMQIGEIEIEVRDLEARRKALESQITALKQQQPDDLSLQNHN